MESRRRIGYNAPYARAFIGSLALLLSALAGQAAPFKPTPASFASWYNATLKSQGGKILIQDLANCSQKYYVIEPVPNTAIGGAYESYSCNLGYVSEKSPMGRLVCQLSKIWWEKNLQTGDTSANYDILTSPMGCRYIN